MWVSRGKACLVKRLAGKKNWTVRRARYVWGRAKRPLLVKYGEERRVVRNEFREKAGGQKHLTGCGEDFAIYSEMRSHWRILNRGVSQTNMF